MDKLRLYVWIALAGAVYYLYITWQVDYPPPPPPTPSAVTAPTASDALPALPADTSAAAIPAPAPTATAPTVEAATAPTTVAAAKVIHVVTDVYDIDISTIGGELIRADLTAYPQSKKNPQPVRLFVPTPQSHFAARTGLRAADERAAPTHQAAFESEAQEYKLAEGQDLLAVKLTWTDAQGVSITKTYTFKRGN